MLTLGLGVIFVGLVIALVAVWRKPKPLKRPDLAPPPRARSIRPAFDDLDDLPIIGGANQARMARKRQATRTGTIYVPPSEPEPVTSATPTDPEYLANVIQMHSVAAATTPEHHHHAPTPEPCAPSHDTSNHHTPSVDTHCHTSSDFGGGSGGGFDGGGHHGH